MRSCTYSVITVESVISLSASVCNRAAFLALFEGEFTVVNTASDGRVISGETVRVHDLPLPEPHELHLGPTVGGREDVPLVDESPPTVPEYPTPFLLCLPEEREEGILPKSGVISSQDEASVRVQISALLSFKRGPVGRSVTGAAGVGGGLLTADLSLLRITDQALQFSQLLPPLSCVPGQTV